MSKSKLVIITVVVTILAVAGIRLTVGKKTVEQKPQLVRLVAVERTSLTEFVNAPGEIQPKNKVELSAKLSAKIVDLPFDEGDTVKAGDVVVKLDDSDMQSALLIAQANYQSQQAQIKVEESRIVGYEADLKTTQVQLTEAQSDYQRQKQLRESKDISQAAYDSSDFALKRLAAVYESEKIRIATGRLNLEVLKYNLQAADANIQQVKENLEYTTIKSPIDGVITRLNAEIGEVVVYGTMNNPGTIILEVADLSKMMLVSEIDESDIAAIKVGQKATLSVQAYPDRKFTGVVETIALKQRLSSSGVKYYETEIAIDNEDDAKLYSGLTSDVDIETVKHENVLIVPTQSILGINSDDLPFDIRTNNPDVNLDKTFATVVYRCIDGKAVVTPVKIGSCSQLSTIVLSGLEEKDLVIAGPFKVLENLKHNALVKDEKTSPEEISPDTGIDAEKKKGSDWKIGRKGGR